MVAPETFRIGSSFNRNPHVFALNANFKANQNFTLPLNAKPSRLTAATFAEGLRRRAGLLAEEARKMRGIGEREIIGDLVDLLAGENELAFGLGQHALADQMAGRDAGCTLDVIVQSIRCHC